MEEHPVSDRIFTYNTLTDLAADAAKVPAKWQTGGHDCPMSYADACQAIVRGDASQVPRAEKLLDQLMTDSVEVMTPMWEASVWGAYPSVPDFLSGHPQPMRALVPQVAEKAPIKIWVDLASSAGVTLEELERRGITILALLLKLQQTRPVDLVLCYGAPSNGVGMVLPWQTRPMDLSTTCAMLCSGTLTRYPLMAVLRHKSRDLIGMGLRSEAHMREFFSIPEGDLCIGRMDISDYDFRDNPLGWINRQLAKFSDGGGEE